MQEKDGMMNRIKDIINGSTDAERDRKASMQGKIDQADHVFHFFLLLFGLGFWVVMILKMYVVSLLVKKLLCMFLKILIW